MTFLKKIDIIIIKILLRICDMLSEYSEKITSGDFFAIRQDIEAMDGESNEE